MQFNKEGIPKYRTSSPTGASQSDAPVVVKVGDLINMAMGPTDKNTVNFKMIQTILHILARNMRLLDQQVELRSSDLTPPKLPTKERFKASRPESKVREKIAETEIEKEKADKEKSKDRETPEKDGIKKETKDTSSPLSSRSSLSLSTYVDEITRDKYFLKDKKDEREKELAKLAKIREVYLHELRKKEREKAKKGDRKKESRSSASSLSSVLSSSMTYDSRDDNESQISMLLQNELERVEGDNKMEQEEKLAKIAKIRDKYSRKKEKQIAKLTNMNDEEREHYLKDKDEKSRAKERERHEKEMTKLPELNDKERKEHLKENKHKEKAEQKREQYEKDMAKLPKMNEKEKENYLKQKEKEERDMTKDRERADIDKEKEKEKYETEKENVELKEKYLKDKEQRARRSIDAMDSEKTEEDQSNESEKEEYYRQKEKEETEKAKLDAKNIEKEDGEKDRQQYEKEMAILAKMNDDEKEKYLSDKEQREQSKLVAVDKKRTDSEKDEKEKAKLDEKDRERKERYKEIEGDEYHKEMENLSNIDDEKREKEIKEKEESERAGTEMDEKVKAKITKLNDSEKEKYMMQQEAEEREKSKIYDLDRGKAKREIEQEQEEEKDQKQEEKEQKEEKKRDKKRDKEYEKELDKEHEKELDKEHEIELDKEHEKERDKEHEKEHEIEQDKEHEKERDKVHETEQDKEQEKEREQEAEEVSQKKDHEKEREVEHEIERKTDQEKDQEKDREKKDSERDQEKYREEERGKVRAKEGEKGQEKEREKEQEKERGKEQGKEREKEHDQIKEREQEKELDKDKDKERDIKGEKELEKEQGKEQEKKQEKDQEKVREKKREKEREKETKTGSEYAHEKDRDKLHEKEKELENEQEQEGEKERENELEKVRDKEQDIERARERDKEREKERDRGRDRERETDREKNQEKDREKKRQTEREKKRERKREKEREKERERETKREREMERVPEKEREREKERETNLKEKEWAKGKGGIDTRTPQVDSRTRVGSIEVVTRSEFELLEAKVDELQEKTVPIPYPSMPDNQKLRTDLARGSASLTDTMQAMQVSARVQATETAMSRMADLLTQLAAAGALPQDVVKQVGEVTAGMGRPAPSEAPEDTGTTTKSLSKEGLTTRSIGTSTGPGLAGRITGTVPRDGDEKVLSVGTAIDERIRSVGIKTVTDDGTRSVGIPDDIQSRHDVGTSVSGGAKHTKYGGVTSASRPHFIKACVTHPELDDAIRELQDSMIKRANDMVLKALRLAEIADINVKRVADQMEIATRMAARIDVLFELVNDYAEQLAGFDAGVSTQLQNFNDQIFQMRCELNDGVVMFKQTITNPETEAVRELNKRYEDLVLDLDVTRNTVDKLSYFQNAIGDEFTSLLNGVETMKEQKADRDELLDGIRDKADASKLEGLIKGLDFEPARIKLDERLEEAYLKFKRLEDVWMKAIEDLNGFAESKASGSELWDFTYQMELDLNKVKDEVWTLSTVLGEPKAILLTRKISEGGTCGPCQAPAQQLPTADCQPPLLPVVRRQQPPIAEEPCKQLVPQPRQLNEREHFCKRWTGGSHTMINKTVVHQESGDIRMYMPPTKKYAGIGNDGKMYQLAEVLQPCVDCKPLDIEETKVVEEGAGEPDQDVTTNAVVHAEPIDDSLPPPMAAAPEEIPPVCDVEDIADILGADPTATVEYGPDINKDVATRFTHVVTTGLEKNLRAELIKKNVPGNCPYISAPQLNAEIKAAVPDAVLKRDKAIENRQKQMAAGIACLGKIISDQLAKKEKDNDLIKELMDVGRIFCDIQYSESEMRRNFALYSVRKELKDQLSTTKIDQFLFGKDFTETIKTAKAVTKSSSDLKPDAPKKPKPTTSAGPSGRHLNWRARGRSRRQPTTQPPRQQPPASQNAPPRTTSSQNYTTVQAEPPPVDKQSKHPSPHYPGCRSIVRAAMLQRLVPDSAIEIIMASWLENTLKQYDVCFKKWFAFCTAYNINMYEPSIPIIIEFLTQIFNDGGQFGTINTHRSALALIVGNNMSDDDRITRFCKGVYRLRPPLPRYNATWDASIVLNYLESLYPHDSLSLEYLSKKCVTLLALVTAHRIQTLSKIKIDHIITLDNQIVIKISDLIKTSRAGSKQPTLYLPFFDDRPGICPGKTLTTYLDKTKSLRTSNDLFVSFRKPHNVVSSQTLSRWIKFMLSDSGIDVSVFSSHSTRHAATSKAHKLGVNLDIIRQTAGWTGNSTTFAKFYNRPVINDEDNTALARTICTR